MKIILFQLSFMLLTISISIGQQLNLSSENFKNPPLKYHSRPLWFWNDTTVTKKGIEQQMQDFRDKSGYGGFGILPFGKRFKPEYLSPQYFEVYKAALEKAKSLGLTMCLYDEFGFPSGGIGAVNGDGINRFQINFPEQTIKRLDKTEVPVHGNSLVNEKIPVGNLQAVIAMEKTKLERINLRKFIKDGILDWKSPTGEWTIMFFNCVKDGDPILDYLDPVATQNFIKMTHEAYYERFKEYFGTVISGTFFDEPTMYRAKGRMWTPLFNEKFQKKYGFNPEMYYPALWYDIGPETRVARNYLFGFRSELYAEGFTKEVSDWSLKHGVMATGHQDQEEVINPVSVSGDLMKCFKYLDIPGIDKIGGNRPAERFYKIVSSAANNWDHQLVMSETYGAMGNISWNEIISVAMDQYAKGINQLIPHAVWYNDKKVVFKPELSYRNPIYADSLQIFNQFMARLNLILQNPGQHVADIAVLYPIHMLQGEHFLDGPLASYKGGVAIPKADYVDVANWLTEDAGKDFTFLHPEVLDEKCSVSDKRLHLQNKINKESFSVMVIPSCRTISLSNLKKIKTFYDNGGNLIFTTQLPEFATESGKDQEIKTIINSIFTTKVSVDGKLMTSHGGGKAIFIAEPNGQTITEALHKLDISFDVEYNNNRDIRYIHKIINGKDTYYFANLGATSAKIDLVMNGKHQPKLMDPHNGEIQSIEAAPLVKNGLQKTKILLTLEPVHSVFLVE